MEPVGRGVAAIEYGAAPYGRPARGRRRRRALVAALATLLVLIGGAGLAAWMYTRQLNSNIQRTNAFAGLPSRAPDVVSGAMNILVVGSDSRDPASTLGSRTDTIMLAHLDADHKHAYVISIPRDTWVYVPPSTTTQYGGTMAKINAAYAWGGLPLMVQTVEEFTGVHIDHVVLIDFAGFKQVVDALGGVDMYVSQTITSIFPPHRVFTKGEQHFNGAEALDYVRQRYQFANGDFTREQHQQEFLKALLNKAASSGTLSNPVQLNAFLQAVTKSITVDQNFNVIGTALQLSGMRTKDLTFMTSPSAGTGWEGDQSVVLSDSAKAKALYQAVADDTVASWAAANMPSASPSASSTGQ